MPVIGQISVGDGATFTPSVDSAGNLSWTNNKNLPNPATVDLAQAVLDSGASLFLPLTGGTVTGTVEVTGGVTADVTGNLTGDVTGNVTGDVTGNLTGNVTGDVTGDLTGNVTGNADTATNATNDGNGNQIDTTYLPIVVGAVMAFAGSTSPAGWLLCDGSAVSRTDYADLFAVIGTTYGIGDGVDTFNLPDLADKFIQGNSTSGTVKSAGLPNISGSFNVRGLSNGNNIVTSASAPFSRADGSSVINSATSNSTDATYSVVTFSATSSNSIYGNSTTVQPPALTMRYIIKY